MQSRAFLSQLSVTGDESGFFYAFSKVGIFYITTIHWARLTYFYGERK